MTAPLLVHEWIESAGGAEKVLDRFAGLYPESEILCLWNDAPGRYESSRVVQTWLAGTPLRRSKISALPFMPMTWSHRSENADWMLISSHLFAHHATLRDQSIPKLVYVHTPARYLWAPELDPRGRSLPVRTASRVLKPLDARRARQATSITANSHFIARRIADAWDVDARVIYPPVDIRTLQSREAWAETLSEQDHATLERLPQEFVLGASRLVSYKRLDLVIRAAQAADIPAVIAGSGPDEANLQSLAAEMTVPVHFVPRPSDELLYALYERASVFFFPPVEDFGIMPVEAMALGTPTVVNAVGGAVESVDPPRTGALFESETPADLRRAIDAARIIDRRTVAERARSFSAERFDAQILEWVLETLG
ncbi:MAG: glycosyltransferase [Microbacteriaceae bacterium]